MDDCQKGALTTTVLSVYHSQEVWQKHEPREVLVKGSRAVKPIASAHRLFSICTFAKEPLDLLSIGECGPWIGRKRRATSKYPIGQRARALLNRRESIDLNLNSGKKALNATPAIQSARSRVNQEPCVLQKSNDIING